MQDLRKLITDTALKLGFNDVRFISAKPLLEAESKFLAWRDKGYAADMDYLLRDDPINARPEKLLENAKTIIMLSANYYSPCPPRPSLKHGRIAAYAVGLDYHKVLRQKIKDLVETPELKNIFSRSKFFTDSVPLLEKSFAKKAGLGFRGKNTLLISKEAGSFNFISEIVTDLELTDEESLSSLTLDLLPNPPPNGDCGKCTRCIDICPTNALPEPYQLDASKCISYHTIENRGEIPQELAKNFGEWVFGCDLCQTICPYNKKVNGKDPSPFTLHLLPSFPEFLPESGFGHWLYLPEILDLETGFHESKTKLIESLETHKFIASDAFTIIKKQIEKSDNLDDKLFDFIFQTKFARTPLLRAKRSGLIRNAKIVLANSPSLSPPSHKH